MTTNNNKTYTISLIVTSLI